MDTIPRVEHPLRPDQPLRILWVTPTVGTHFGGPTTTVVNGLIAEKRSGLEPELATTIAAGETTHDSPIHRLADNGVRVRLFPRTGVISRGEAWGLSLKLAIWLARNIKKYDVLHLQYVWCLTSIVGAITARRAGVPIVVTPHESLTDFDINVASRHPALKLLKQILRHLYLRTANHLILMSRLEERDTRYEPVPVRIVSHAVLEEPAAELPPDTPIDGRLRIAFLGRNIEKKGIHLILEAIAIRPDRDRRLVIAGPPAEDEYKRELEALIERYEIADRVKWVGFVDDRREFLRGADVLAMPSAYEGFGMVSAEALCVGLPVVVPAMSGVAEVVDQFDAGLVMTTSSAAALDEAFTALEEDPSLGSRLGSNGIRAANQVLTFEAFARETSALYEELLRR